MGRMGLNTGISRALEQALELAFLTSSQGMCMLLVSDCTLRTADPGRVA